MTFEKGFEERFPELSNKVIDSHGFIEVSTKTLLNGLLSKQKVIEVLDKYMDSPSVVFDDEGFRKELGL